MTLQSGIFAGESTLYADAAALLSAATSAAQASECTATLSRFSLLWPIRGDTGVDTPIHIELDGCQRLFVPASHPLVPDPALMAGLATLA